LAERGGEAVMPKEKQYAVEVLEKHQHGKYGKRFYFGMYLPGFNKKDAEGVGIETLASMTFDEINARCIDERQNPWEMWHQPQHERENGKDAPIGFDLAEKFFCCRAYIE
jgi:hypothetical protein